MSFYDIKKLDLQKELEELNKEAASRENRGFQRDPRYWRPQLDSQGSASALIRFCYQPDGEKFPYVQKSSYGFKWPATGRWYIEDSPVTVKLPDPVAELNNRDWNSGTEEGKARARSRRMKHRWISNVYVLEHKARSEDVGKVFLYSYPKTIYEMLKEKREPSFADVEAFNPFNFWSGANFRLRIKKKEGYPNYEASSFEVPGPFVSDEELERIYRQLYPLGYEVTPDKFKTYEELKRKLEDVLGEGVAPKAPVTQVLQEAPWEPEKTEGPEEEEGIEFFQQMVASRQA